MRVAVNQFKDSQVFCNHEQMTSSVVPSLNIHLAKLKKVQISS